MKISGILLLIVPYWNWNPLASVSFPVTVNAFNRTILELKYFGLKMKAKIYRLLIVPYWNWNEITNGLITLISASFNRTILELKSAFLYIIGIGFKSFNRTILELKYAYTSTSYLPISAFNRTILELKWITWKYLSNWRGF